MDKVDQDVIFKGYTEIEAQGEKYLVRPLNTEDVIDGAFGKNRLRIPTDETKLGEFQCFNLAYDEPREDLFSLMENHLFKDGKPVTGDDIKALKWEMPDIGRFLYTLVKASG